MKYLRSIFAVIALALTLVAPMQAVAQIDASRLERLEQRVEQVESRVRHQESAGVALFLCGAFCALWAQQTRRNAWLWFFLGAFFNVITLLVLLYKNSQDKELAAPNR